jgi:uncharacterized membrane protein
MIKNMIITGFVITLITFMKWKELSQGTRTTRWLTFIVFGISGILWVYITTKVHVPRPSKWLEAVLEPFDPIK